MIKKIRSNLNGWFILIVILCTAVYSGCNEKPKIPKVKLVEGAGNMKFDKTADYGGFPSQSFNPIKSGKAVAIRFLIEGRENPRDLMVLLRKADLSGYPTGIVLGTALATIPVSKEQEAIWHELIFDDPVNISSDSDYAMQLMPSTSHSGYGYFEYAYTHGDKYTAGRLHTKSPGRSVPEDYGNDLCFQLILEVGSEADGTPVSPVESQIASVNAKLPLTPTQQVIQKEANPELDRLLRFMKLNHLDFTGYSGMRLQIWTNNDGLPGESIEDKIIPEGKFDVYYGHSQEGYPIFHMIDFDGGGGTRYLPRIERTHYYTDIFLEQAKGKSLLIGKEYGGKNNFWLRLDTPSENTR